MPQQIHMEWQIKLGLHLVLVRLHGGFLLELSETNQIADGKYNV